MNSPRFEFPMRHAAKFHREPGLTKTANYSCHPR